MRSLRRLRLVLAAFLVGGLVGGLLTGCQSTSETPDPPPVTIDDLRAAGIAILQDEHGEVPARSLSFTAIQTERMLNEAALGTGVRGADLDELAPMPEGAPPTSYLIAAWIDVGGSDAARAARAAMGERTWGSTAEVLFPTVVVALFAADFIALIEQAAPEIPPSPEAGAAAPGSAVVAAVLPERAHDIASSAGLCTTAAQYLAATIKAVFDGLRLEVSTGSGFFDAVIGAVAAVWNRAVEIARGIVEATVETLTRPVFEALKVVAAGLGAASVLISYLKGTTLEVTTDADLYRLAVGDEPDLHAG